MIIVMSPSGRTCR